MQTQEISPQAAQELARYEAERTIFNLRKQAAAEIERLIAFMDETDGYTTTEFEGAVDDRGCCDDEMEKSLSGIHAHHIPDAVGDKFGDLEFDDGDLEPDSEGEPSLCGVSAADGCGDGRDLEFDDSDKEPSLGWTAEEAARGRTCAGTMGRCFDLEDICEDEGAEHDGCEPDNDLEPGRCESDVIAARARGKSATPGISVRSSYGSGVYITGLTQQQEEALGTNRVSRW